MPRRAASILSALLFISLVHAVVYALHYYVWARFVRDTALGSHWHLAGTIVIVTLAIGLPLSFIFIRVLTPRIFRLLAYPLYLWMGLLFLLFVVLLAADLIRLGAWVILRLTTGPVFATSEGQLMIARLVAAAASTAALVAGLVGLRNAVARVQTRRISLTLDRLPRALDGFTIVQLSDLHLGAPLGRRWLEAIVAQVNALGPDLIAITGDLVDGPVEILEETAAPLAGLEAPAGVFFVTGNHEYYAGVSEWIPHLRSLGIEVLVNERITIGEGAATFDLAGVNDQEADRIQPGEGPDLERALRGRDPRRELVLLAHQPRTVLEAAARGVGLQLSGHTHGGQIWPMHYLVRLQQPYLSGLVRHGPTQLYVSQGTGLWGPPMRLGTRSEITVVELKAPAPPDPR